MRVASALAGTDWAGKRDDPPSDFACHYCPDPLPARLGGDPALQWDFLRDATQKTGGGKPVMDFEPGGDGDTVTSFLLAGTPGSRPFRSGAQPQDLVLVSASEPIPADITAELVLTGKFEVDQNDETGFYYRLRDAKRK